MVLDWGHDALVSPIDFRWSFDFDGFLLSFDVIHVHHVVDQDFFDEFFLGHVGEFVDSHEVGLGFIRVVFVDFFQVVLEDLESEGFFFGLILLIELELEVSELNFEL